MTALEQSSLKKVVVKDKDGSEVHLEKESAYYSPAPMPPVYPAASAVQEKQTARIPQEEKKPEEKQGAYISSPLVGTFYEAPSPEEPSFIKVGDQVDENTVVCIVEAMKVMNEVKAGIKGKVKEVLIDNAHPVEFGTKLFLVE